MGDLGTGGGRPTGEVNYLVLGAGSAGAVMAARLSEDTDQRVVLVEMGPDLSGNGLPEHSRDIAMRAIFARAYFGKPIWLENPVGPGSNEMRRAPTRPAQVVGGGSFVNGMQAVRGLCADHDEWVAAGATGWGADDLLPYFKKVETDLDFQGPTHGSSGPIHIQRIREGGWSPLTRAVCEAFTARGIGLIPDMNDGISTVGFGPVPMNFGAEGRMSTANAYLTADVRRRSNLKIVPNTCAVKIIFEGARAVGALCRDAGGEYTIKSENVILCCGTLLSPAVLQRSGIGPGEVLRQAGVPVIADRRGVGRNLTHHAVISLNVHLKAAGRVTGDQPAPCPVVVRYSSHAASGAEADLYLYVWERATPAISHLQDRLGRQLGNLMLQLNKCHSTGEVTIRPEDPFADPIGRSNLLGDERDSRRFIAAVRDLIDLSTTGTLRGLINERLFVKFTPMTRKTMEDTSEGRFLNRLAAVALAGPSFLRRALLSQFSTFLDGMSDDALTRAVYQNASTSHIAGTCRLGAAHDEGAVVDARARVIGVERLRVVDASILPTLPIGGPNVPIMMSAEKVADMVKEDRRAGI